MNTNIFSIGVLSDKDKSDVIHMSDVNPFALYKFLQDTQIKHLVFIADAHLQFNPSFVPTLLRSLHLSQTHLHGVMGDCAEEWAIHLKCPVLLKPKITLNDRVQDRVSFLQSLKTPISHDTSSLAPVSSSHEDKNLPENNIVQETFSLQNSDNQTLNSLENLVSSCVQTVQHNQHVMDKEIQLLETPIPDVESLSENFSRNSFPSDYQNRDIPHIDEQKDLSSETNSIDSSENTSQNSDNKQSLDNLDENLKDNTDNIMKTDVPSHDMPVNIENTIQNEPSLSFLQKQRLQLKGRIRTGRTVSWNGDIVIEGSVHPGAEIIATGDIHIYGSASGRLSAGVSGQTQACIYIQSFDAEMVSIAGHYYIIEDPQNSWIGKCLKISLHDHCLVFEELNPHHLFAQQKSIQVQTKRA